MLIMERGLQYPEILWRVKGKRVAVWTCNTCARLCNGIGGQASAERMAESLRKDGVEVTCVLSTSASCLMAKVKERDCGEISSSDVILALTCDMGSRNASAVFGKDVINPLVTLGPGYLDEGGRPFLPDGSEPSELCSPYF